VSSHRVTVTFPADLESASAARHFLEDRLREWGAEDLVESARLLVSELMVNAVLHSGTAAQLTVDLEPGCLRVEVGDGGTGEVVQQPYEPESPTGRGLMIVDALASRWGVDDRPRGGKVVWFEIERDDAGAGHRPTSSSRRR
jgi:anti-sigma regulatory factor (Ser/Thr protein kinase)